MSFSSRAVVRSLSALASFLLPLTASAQTPPLINYQGRLVNGTNLVNGSVGLSLRLFDASSGGTKLYEDSNTVTVADGLYATLIGDNSNFGSLQSALETTNVWVEVAVNGTALSPREPVASVAGSLRVAGLQIRGDGSVIVRPDANTISTSAISSVVGGGQGNTVTAGAFAGTVSGGFANEAGDSGTVPGGNYNSATGQLSFAAGYFAQAHHPGSFVWSGYVPPYEFASTASNQFLIRAPGGVGIGTNVTTGAVLTVAGPARFTGTLTAPSFTGSGAPLTGLSGTQLVAGSVSGTQIADGSISNADLAAGAVTTTHVLDGSLTGTDIANGSISNADLAAGAVTTATVLDGTLTGTDISDGTISVSDLAANSFWTTGGNAGTAPATHYLGTGDNQPIEIRVNGTRAARFVPASPAPNILFGTAANAISNGTSGASVLGGISNTVAGASSNSVIAGGRRNSIGSNSFGAVIGGGERNRIDAGAEQSVVAGGIDHAIGTNCSNDVIGGGQQNQILSNSFGSAIAGGSYNTVGGANDSVIAGGSSHRILGGQRNAIGGGLANTIRSNAWQSAIAGGYNNEITADDAFIGGGRDNVNQAGASTIGGGDGNHIGPSGPPFNRGNSTIAGGSDNSIAPYADASVIAGGITNTIGSSSRGSSILGGEFNAIDDSAANGVILGGQYNEIWPGATNSTVGGTRAIAFNKGSFVWADSQAGSFGSSADDQVAFRCKGGVVFSSGATGANQRVTWAPGSAGWSFLSDRNSKEALQPVDVGQILEKVARLPISEWQYKGYTQRHIGPMAQDFHAAFPLNEDDSVLNDADLHGVALAAIQALAKQNADLRLSNAELKQQLDEVLRRQRELESSLQAVLKAR